MLISTSDFAYYNEFDPYAAQFLRNLIKRGVIANGFVDERDIRDVLPSDLAGFKQCHFFAGLGGWSYALRLAGYADSDPVWTASCPCQPFSAAGAGAGFADERHLWPAFCWLVAQRRPSKLFGEQVASKTVEPWIDLVHADLEALDYAFGCIAFPSAGVGAPHIRDRAYWVADSDYGRFESRGEGLSPMGYGSAPESDRGVGRLADAHQSGLEGRIILPQRGNEWAAGAHGLGIATDQTNSQWRKVDWLLCRDGKWRPVEPGTLPLADGVSARVGRLRAYGNAINPYAASAFIQSYDAIGLAVDDEL